MKRVLTPKLPTPTYSSPLSEAEANHLVQVLRLRDGDAVEALDGSGHSIKAILRVRGGESRLEHAGEDAKHAENEQTLPLTVEMAILKGDAMEWVVEKCVELGVRTLVPFVSAHTVVQIDKKGPEAFRERWQKIADQALKQCGRLERMTVESPVTLEKTLTLNNPGGLRIWCAEPTAASRLGTQPEFLGDLLKAIPRSTPLRVLIGPEGGWSFNELQLLEASQGAAPLKAASLGPVTLRAETAALFSVAAIASQFRAKT